MGCDIHYVVERRIGGKWIGLFSKYPRAGFAGERDYSFFAEIAGVRGHSSSKKYPRFLPGDISDLALALITEDGSDGHSHSWMPLQEFSELAVKINPDKFPGESNRSEPWEILFGGPIFINNDGDKIEDFRIVFWFDN